MPRILWASDFPEATVISSRDIADTPFGNSASQGKMAWAYRQLDECLQNDILELPLTAHGPSAATILDWLHKALEESGELEKYRLSTKNRRNILYVRKVERKGERKGARVKHVIT